MSNKKWIIGGTVVIAAVVAYVALQGPKSGLNTEGTIGAANRYQSQQIGNSDVSLDNPQVAAFIQSDVFRKLASNEAFREAARSEEFSRFVKSDGLREASAKYDLARVLENARVQDLLKDEAFSAAMTDAALHDAMARIDMAYLSENNRFQDLLRLESLKELAAKVDFRSLCDAAARKEGLTAQEFARMADSYASLKDSDAMRALEGNKVFEDALGHGVLDMFRNEDVAAKFEDAGFRAMLESKSFQEAIRIEGFKPMMDALSVENYAVVRDLAREPEVLNVLRDDSFREAAARVEMKTVAEVGFKEALARYEQP